MMIRVVLMLCCATVLLSCTSLPMVDAPSQNHNSRIEYLVIHFTSEDFAESLRLLTQPTDNSVSAHYLIPESGDDTYDLQHLRVHRLVPEPRRAWHAGTSYWHGEVSLNHRSIGIELVNRSACSDDDPDAAIRTPEKQTCIFLDYSEQQFALLISLAGEILGRYPEIDPIDIIGHADIAPERKVDPGPLFPWRRLHAHGIGAWFDEETVAKYRELFERDMPDIALMQRALHALGYGIDESGEDDAQTRFAIRAFQMHFRPSGYSGQLDDETAALLFALIDKYRPDELNDLMSR